MSSTAGRLRHPSCSDTDGHHDGNPEKKEEKHFTLHERKAHMNKANDTLTMLKVQMNIAISLHQGSDVVIFSK